MDKDVNLEIGKEITQEEIKDLISKGLKIVMITSEVETEIPELFVGDNEIEIELETFFSEDEETHTFDILEDKDTNLICFKWKRSEKNGVNKIADIDYILTTAFEVRK